MVLILAARRTTGGRNSLGEELDDLLADYSTAHYGAPASQIIRVAVREHVQRRLEAEPELRKRFEEARRERLNLTPPKIVRLT